MKYRKITDEVEAFQYGREHNIPDWLDEMVNKDLLFYVDKELYMKTIEGNIHIDEADYIVKDSDGEIYACKPDVFEKTYVKEDSDLIKIKHNYQDLYETVSKLFINEEVKNRCLRDLKLFYADYSVMERILTSGKEN